MSQTAYTEQAVGQVGQLVDSGENDVISRIAEGAVPFGRFQTLGTDVDRQCKLPAAGADVTSRNRVLGVSVRTQGMEAKDYPTYTGDPRYADMEMVSVLRKGRIWMIAEDAVTPESAVFVRFQGGNEGAVRSDADGGDAAALSTDQARFLSSAGAGDLVQVELSL